MAATVREHQMKAVTAATRAMTGSGAADTGGDLSERTRDELYEMAGEKGISGRSDMNKEELIKALQGS